MEIDRNKITLKKATISDIETIIEYRIIFLQEVQGIPGKELELSLRKSLWQYFTKSIENDSFISWIAEYENKSIGFSGMVIKEQPGNFEIPNGKIGYILNMFTLKEFRNNGIGTLLFQKLIDEATQRNLDRIDLHATQDGEPIYKRFGFTEPHDKVLEQNLNIK
ncbi:MAG: GNAT family N-acetyltransferase [Bacteroidetes bacterium]|nr:MAG: GNAT family N-acetyltransferase [Bacteroidota bacterium]